MIGKYKSIQLMDEHKKYKSGTDETGQQLYKHFKNVWFQETGNCSFAELYY